MKFISGLTCVACRLIGLETYRVVSGNKSDHETPRTPEPSFRGESQADSGSITSLEAQHGGLHRQDTSGLAQTLVQPATFNSISGSSAWSATDSTNSTSTLCFSESKQLRSAVCEEDFLWIQRQIKEGKSENEVSTDSEGSASPSQMRGISLPSCLKHYCIDQKN